MSSVISANVEGHPAKRSPAQRDNAAESSAASKTHAMMWSVLQDNSAAPDSVSIAAVSSAAQEITIVKMDNAYLTYALASHVSLDKYV